MYFVRTKRSYRKKLADFFESRTIFSFIYASFRSFATFHSTMISTRTCSSSSFVSICGISKSIWQEGRWSSSKSTFCISTLCRLSLRQPCLPIHSEVHHDRTQMINVSLPRIRGHFSQFIWLCVCWERYANAHELTWKQNLWNKQNRGRGKFAIEWKIFVHFTRTYYVRAKHYSQKHLAVHFVLFLWIIFAYKMDAIIKLYNFTSN